jgi:A/G-specific adenine glycosylase
MLQQTRIEVVKPAYARFLRAFPSLKLLAAASDDDVLAQWSGLGYYSRARALHRAARLLAARGTRQFPEDYDEARALPGVGRYTAAAVLSIAYGLPYAAVDGNIVRVLSRLECLPRPDIKSDAYHALADELLDRRHAGDWNQALMELGQTICLPKVPRCGECPVRRHCRALIEERVHLHPPPKPRRKPEKIELTMTVVRDRAGRILLQRGDFPYLPHMWLPPIEIGSVANGSNPVAEFRHTILHRDFKVSAKGVTRAGLERKVRSNPHQAIHRRGAGIGRRPLLTKR